MELADFSKIELKDVISGRYTYFLTSSTESTDHFYVGENPAIRSLEKVLLPHDDLPDCLCRQKKDFLDGLGLRKVSLLQGEKGEFSHFVTSICNSGKNEQIDLLIDYSCMPLSWYAEIIDAIGRVNSGARVINTYMAYLPKRCRSDRENIFKAAIGSTIKRDSKKPLSLIAGLNNTPFRLEDLETPFKPREVFAFIPDSPGFPGYAENIRKVNKDILSELSASNIIKYSMDNPEDINSRLASICLRMRLHSDVAVVMRGPKVFSMISLLLSMQYPDIKLLEMKGKKSRFPFVSKEENALPVVFKATFCEELEDLERSRIL